MEYDDIKKMLQEKCNINAKKIIPLAGLSSRVFKVETYDNKNYVFKIFTQDASQIFKLLERHAIKKAHYKELLIVDTEEHRLENYIEHVEVDKQTFMKEPMCLYQMYCLAKFNKCNSVVSERPNLFYIVENSKQQLYDVMNKNIAKIEDKAARIRVSEQLAVVNKVYDYYRQKCKPETLVLSHNDCYYRNYLYSPKERQLFLIDYEYAGYNPLGMDVLVLYQEYLCDYEAKKPPGNTILYSDFPNDVSFRRLLRFHLYFYKYMEDLSELKHDDNFTKTVEADPRFHAIGDNEIEAVLARFGYFGVLCQIFFFYWAVYLFNVKDIDFDYVKFAGIKYELLDFFLKRDGSSIKLFEEEVEKAV